MKNLIRLLLMVICATLLTATARAQQVMDNAAVLKLEKAGLGDDLIVSSINGQPGHYSLSADDMIALKQAGVSDRVMAAMIAKNSGATAPAAPAVAATAAGAIPAGVTDVGVYYQDKSGQWTDVMSEIVNYKTGGILKGIASAGLIKGDLNGNINGKESKLKLSSPVNIIIYVMEGQSPTEYQLLRLRPNSDYREFRSKTGGIVHESTGASRDMVDFDAKKIAPRVYQVTLPASLGKGEYGFLPPMTMNSGTNAASSGKIYTFSLLE
jgi:hypothetical protein